MSDATRINAQLRMAHRAALVALAVCAVAVVSLPVDADAPPAARGYTWMALGCAVASIVCRQLAESARSTQGRRLGFSIGRFAFASATGLIAIAVVLAGSSPREALLYILAGAIFAFRPPSPVASPPSTD